MLSLLFQLCLQDSEDDVHVVDEDEDDDQVVDKAEDDDQVVDQAEDDDQVVDEAEDDDQVVDQAEDDDQVVDEAEDDDQVVEDLSDLRCQTCKVGLFFYRYHDGENNYCYNCEKQLEQRLGFFVLRAPFKYIAKIQTFLSKYFPYAFETRDSDESEDESLADADRDSSDSEHATRNRAQEYCAHEHLQLAMDHCPKLKEEMNAYCHSKGIDLNDYDEFPLERVLEIAKRFSELALLHRGKPKARAGDRDFKTKVLGYAYNRGVLNAPDLNKHYTPFSSEVYGETTVENLKAIMDYIKPTNNDVFVDLATTNAKKAIGIELSQPPFEVAQILKKAVKESMVWHGEQMQEFDLLQGSFLDDHFKPLIVREATILFMNNYIFTPELNESIKTDIIMKLKEGTRIISVLNYARNRKQLNERNISDVSSILDVEELPMVANSVSFSSQSKQYYLFTVNHKRRDEFLKQRDEAAKKSGRRKKD